MDGKTAVGLLKTPSPIDAVFDALRRRSPSARQRCRLPAGSARLLAVGLERRDEPVQPVGSATGAGKDVGFRLHLSHALGGPAGAVAGGPGGIGGQVGGQCHQCPGGLLPRADVGLGLREQIGDGVGAARDNQPGGERNAAGAALREVAEPLVGMPLADVASFFQQRQHAGRTRPQRPALEQPASEEIVEGAGDFSVVGQGEIGAEGQNAMHDLPGPMHRGIEAAPLPSLGEDGVDSGAEGGPVGRLCLRGCGICR